MAWLAKMDGPVFHVRVLSLHLSISPSSIPPSLRLSVFFKHPTRWTPSRRP